MPKILNQLDKANSRDENPDTIASFSSLKNHNNAISSKMKNANEAFYKSYQAANGPTPEPDSRKNYRTYPYDYFSGIDAKVFFGDVWVDDIVTIQYSVTQNKVPIYGYASQLYDAIARGTVIVQGSLTISFKEMGYLNMVQRIIETQRAGAASAIENKVAELQKKGNKLQFIPNLEGSLDKTGNSIGINGVGFSPNGTAQIIRQSETIEEILKRKKSGNVVSSGLGAAYLDDPNGTRDFEDFAEILEDTVWGDSNGHVLGKSLKFRRADEFDYYYANNEDAGGIRVPKGSDYAEALNILITFGDMNDFRAEHTITVLNDIHFTSQSTILAPTGEPVAETYTFFARDINQNITASNFNIPKIKFEVGQNINISKLQDVQALEDFFSVGSLESLEITSVSHFDQDNGWIQYNKKVVTGSFIRNNYEQLVDQLIREVERNINDTTYSELDPAYSQHVLTIDITTKAGPARLENKNTKFTFIVQQQIGNTLSYKVITPTRNNFSATNIMSREDMWGAITTEELAKSKQRIGQPLEQKKQQEEAARKVEAAQADSDKKAKELKAKQDQAALAAQESNNKLIQSMIQASPEEVEAETKKALQTAGLSKQDASVAAKAAAEKQKQIEQTVPLTVLNTKPSQTAYETQGYAGTYSHNDSETDRSKVQIDISPITAGTKGNIGRVYIPASNEAQFTFGKSSVVVYDPKYNQKFTVAHIQIEQQYIGKNMSLSQITNNQKLSSGGLYVTPLSIDPSSKKFRGSHGHFQQDITGSQVNDIASVQQARERFRQYLQESYQKENITYKEVNIVPQYPTN